MNKDLEDEIKKEGFVKKNLKKGKNYIKDEAVSYTGAKNINFFTKRLLKDVNKLNPFKEKEEDGKVETFENAVNRLNLNDQDLKSSYNYYKFYFYFGCALSIISFLTGAYFTIVNNDFWSIGPVIACLCFGFSQIVIGSFRTYQINNRNLCGFEEWKAQGFYFPSKFMSMKEFQTEKRKIEKKALERIKK